MKNLPDHLEVLRNRQLQANKVFKPLFYRLQDENGKSALQELLKSPGLMLTDPISDQMKELIRFKNPGVRFSTKDLELETKNLLSGRTPEEFGVWVYYPWSNRLVHCLDEEDFVNIRTSRNQYKITLEERNVLARKKIGVIGLSVGQSVSVTVAMERLCGELRLADFDTLELNNLNRIRTGIHNLGLPKVYSVAREIAEIDPFLKVTCYTEGLTEENMDAFFTEGGKLDLLIEESDGFDIKILSRYKARHLKIPVLMEASDRCMVDVERFDLEPERSILHGIVDHLDVATLKSLQTSEEKIPYMLDVLGIETSSVRLRASMVEMNQTINTWPQLASAVTMGGGITADVARRLLLNQYTESGRYHVDIEEIIGNKKDKAAATAADPRALDMAGIKALCGGYKGRITSDAEEAELEGIVAAAALAPSYANRQPWRWVAFRRSLFLFREAPLFSAIDAQHAGADASLGAAIENAVLTAEAMGLEAVVDLLPDPAHADMVAVISFRRKQSPAPPNDLAAFIPLRTTNRKAGNGEAIGGQLLSDLGSLAQQVAGTEMTLVTDRQKIQQLAAAAGIAERICLLQPELNRDYFSGIRWRNAAQPVSEGMDIRSMELPVLAETALKVVSDSRVSDLLHAWEKGIAFEKMTTQLLGSSSAIGLISIPGYDRAAQIMAGRLAQKAWLTATKNNLAFQPICLPLYLLERMNRGDKSNTFSTKIISELEYVKQQFLQALPVLNSGKGVFMFRLSGSEAPSLRSLRKPLNEVYYKL